jgi:hypothetical protein
MDALQLDEVNQVMTHSFKLSRRIARLRAPAAAAVILAFTACDTTNSLAPDASASPEAVVPASVEAPSFSSMYAGGIPMGTTNQPTTEFGTRYNGSLRVSAPDNLLATLAAIKARGGKVVLGLAGNQKHYVDSKGHFSLTLWKSRIGRFKGINFSSYVNDGTVVGHFLLDEPNDPTNWHGTTVSGATVEEMARYSKQLWPGMATIVRAEPGYLAKFSVTYRYLDAAWAQYVVWKGSPATYLARNVADAQKKGLGLVVGLNILHGGANRSKMSASQVKTFGTAMLNSSYPCAFLSWQYNSTLLSSSSMKDAMSAIRSKAQNRVARSCRG